MFEGLLPIGSVVLLTNAEAEDEVKKKVVVKK